MVDKKEYIERGAFLKTPPFTKYGGMSSEYAEGYLDCADDSRKAVKEAPAADVVSRGVYDQVKWERDMAMQQLEEHGIPFGAKADVVVVRHGYWKNYGAFCVCSVCEGSNPRTKPYCQNCGAKMDATDTNVGGK